MAQKKNTILVVEDELPIRKILNISLEGAGYKVVECDNGQEGARLAASVTPDLIILDLGLPDIDGKEVIAKVREWSHIPIIVCSARNTEMEIVSALSTGADDYVTKPFNSAILLARIEANLRKSVIREADEPALINGSIRMDLVRHEVFIGDKKQVFTPREYELLRYLLVHCGKMLTHKQILKEVWGDAHLDDTQYLRVYIRQLREKIEIDPTQPRYILTEQGIGYRMETTN